MSYLGERGVLCVGNGWHFCTPVLMNMCNITFEVSRLSTFVFKKYSEKNKPSRLNNSDKSLKGFDWNNVGPASQTVTQHYISIGPMHRVIWFSGAEIKASPGACSSQKKLYNCSMLFQFRASVEDCGSTMKQHWVNAQFLCKVYSRPSDGLVLGESCRRLTCNKPAMGCDASPSLNRN